jgi:hypothetical protein
VEGKPFGEIEVKEVTMRIVVLDGAYKQGISKQTIYSCLLNFRQGTADGAMNNGSDEAVGGEKPRVCVVVVICGEP